MTDLYETMRNAPTTRRFRSTPVAMDTIHRVLDNARFAPSGGNRQGWRVVVVDDAGLRRALRDLYLPGWRAYLEATGGAAALAAAAGELEPRRIAALRGADDYARRLDEVPLHLVVCIELGAVAIVDSGLARPSIVGGASIYPFVQNVLLGLRREDLGAAFTTLLTPAEAQVKELLGIADDAIAVVGHIGVGERVDPWPRLLARNPVESFAFSNRWGEPLLG
jgi:nitroreductase